MDGSPSAIITFGLGTGTFNGSPSLMVTRGLGVGEAIAIVAGPYRVTAQDYHIPGASALDYHMPGSSAADYT